jgi:hypothetical protein
LKGQRNLEAKIILLNFFMQVLEKLSLCEKIFHEKSQSQFLNPYKIGPFGEPIKTGLLGRFPTLREEDGDVESCRPPPSPHPVQQTM